METVASAITVIRYTNGRNNKSFEAHVNKTALFTSTLIRKPVPVIPATPHSRANELSLECEFLVNRMAVRAVLSGVGSSSGDVENHSKARPTEHRHPAASLYRW